MSQFTYGKPKTDVVVKAATLVQLSNRGRQPFATVWEELMPCLIRGNFSFQFKHENEVGFIAWAKLSPVISQLFVGRHRNLTPYEHNTGPLTFVLFCGNTVGDAAAHLENIAMQELTETERSTMYIKSLQGVKQLTAPYVDIREHLV